MNHAPGSSARPARELSALLRRFSELGHTQLRRAAAEDLYPGAGAPAIDKLAEQILFERWLKRPSWRLDDEALPLLAGIDPAQWQELEPDEDLGTTAAALTGALCEGLGVHSTGASLAPAAFYEWARREGLALPAAFEQLMQFIQSTVKRDRPEAPAAPAGPARLAEHGGERMLGAALCVLARWPERCRDEYGNVSAARIVEMIHKHAVLWFETGRPALDDSASIALIERWLV